MQPVDCRYLILIQKDWNSPCSYFLGEGYMNRMWEQSGLAIIDPSHSYLGTVYTVLSLRQSRLLLKDVSRLEDYLGSLLRSTE